MRWFLSYWLTVGVSIVAIIGATLSGASLLNVGKPFGWLIIPAIVSAVYVFIRIVLHRVLAYTESAIEASPRGDGVRGRRRAAVGNAAYTAFGNPTGLWLAPFAFILSIAAALVVFLRWGLGRPDNLLLTVALTLMGLYAVVTVSAMANPDRPQPLNYVEEDPELDPILEHPDETTADRIKTRLPFRRRKPAAPSTP